jgi:hypothetical protein
MNLRKCKQCCNSRLSDRINGKTGFPLRGNPGVFWCCLSDQRCSTVEKEKCAFEQNTPVAREMRDCRMEVKND